MRCWPSLGREGEEADRPVSVREQVRQLLQRVQTLTGLILYWVRCRDSKQRLDILQTWTYLSNKDMAKCSLSLPKSKMFEKTDFSLLTMKQPLVKSRCSLCPESRDLTLLPLPALIKTQSNWPPDIEMRKYLISLSITKVDQIKWSLSSQPRSENDDFVSVAWQYLQDWMLYWLMWCRAGPSLGPPGRGYSSSGRSLRSCCPSSSSPRPRQRRWETSWPRPDLPWPGCLWSPGDVWIFLFSISAIFTCWLPSIG